MKSEKEKMSDIDRKIAEFCGCTFNPKRGGSWERGTGNTLYDWGYVVRDNYLHDWLLSDSGMRAMMEAVHNDGLGMMHYPATDGINVHIEMPDTRGANYFLGVGSSLPTAVYEAVKQFVEGK